jgi:hypothetical protein
VVPYHYAPQGGGDDTTREATVPRNYFVDQLKPVVGKRVTEVRALTAAELKELYWEHHPDGMAVVVFFEDGTAWLPMQDPEGNGPGFIEVSGSEVVAA